MTTKKKPAEQTAAEIVEPSGASLVLSQVQPGLTIEGNFEALQAHVEKLVEDYRGVIVTADYVPQAKRDRAYLNGLAKDIDSRRLEVKRKFTAPITEFEERIKSIIAPAKEASAAIDVQIKAFEDTERAEKRVEIEKHWKEYAGVLANAVPFERIEDPKWANKACGLMTAFKDVEEIVDRIADDYETLDGLGLTHLTEARTEFVATLDLSRAIARSKQLDEQEAASAKLEGDRQAIIAERAEAEAVTAPVELGSDDDKAAYSGGDGQRASSSTPEEPSVWTFTVTCTRSQLDLIMAACKTLGVSGKVGAR